MKKSIVTALVTAAISVTAAPAADLGKMVTKAPPPPPSPWDVAFGAAIMSDYNFRGISQSDRGPAVSAYFEPRYNINSNWQLYVGIAGTSTKLATDPTAEIDFYGGVRPTFGPLALDFGFIYYYYPRETQQFGPVSFTLSDTDFWEVYGKGVYTINDNFAVGANVYYSPDWLNTGADGTYASGTAKFTAPGAWFPAGWGAYASGEIGYYWLGTTNADGNAYVIPTNLADYAYWNVGFGFTHKVFTLDFRYYDTDLTKGECNVLTGDHTATFSPSDTTPFNNGNVSKWCGAAFVAKLSVDTTLSAIK